MSQEVGLAPSHSFIIRAWLEPREFQAPPEWRWHVRHVQSGEEAYLRDLDGVLGFLRSVSGKTVPLSRELIPPGPNS